MSHDIQSIRHGIKNGAFRKNIIKHKCRKKLKDAGFKRVD
jgi:hypothetical protein